MSDAAPLLSIVTPAFNEEANIPQVYSAIKDAFASLDGGFEWVIVDDHSTDGTFDRVAEISLSDPRVRCIRLSRNSGSHVALSAGWSTLREIMQ